MQKRCLQKTMLHSWQISEQADLVIKVNIDFIKLSLQNLEVVEEYLLQFIYSAILRSKVTKMTRI